MTRANLQHVNVCLEMVETIWCLPIRILVIDQTTRNSLLDPVVIFRQFLLKEFLARASRSSVARFAAMQYLTKVIYEQSCHSMLSFSILSFWCSVCSTEVEEKFEISVSFVCEASRFSDLTSSSNFSALAPWVIIELLMAIEWNCWKSLKAILFS